MLNVKRLLVILVAYSSHVVFANVVATVNGREITDEMLKQALLSLGQHGRFVADHPELRERFLQHLVETELKAAAAQREKLNETDDFRLRMAQAERHILATLYTQRRIEDYTRELALKDFFDQNKEVFLRKEVRIAHILIKERNQASELLSHLLANPEQFADSIRLSQAPDAREGGIRDWFEKGSNGIEFEKAAFSTPKGAIYPHLIETSAGLHILKVLDVRYHDERHYESLREAVKLFRTREARECLASELKTQANITFASKVLKDFKL